MHKYDTAKDLLSHGANINAQDKLGITPAMALILSVKWVSDEDKEMLVHLLSCGLDVTITDKVRIRYDRAVCLTLLQYMSRSLLHYACCLQHDTLLKTLIDKVPGLDINRR